MNREQLRKEKTIQKELARVKKDEAKLAQAAQKARPGGWKQELESRIPEKVLIGLEAAFAKGFSLVFQQGRGIIEKTYNKEDLEADHSIRDFAVRRKGGKKELRKLQSNAKQGSLRNLAMTTVEGIGLGALGIGMPDIVLFLVTLLKGVYETAIAYGFTYDTHQEQLWILKMLSTSLSTGDAWAEGNRQVEEMVPSEPQEITQEALQSQIRQTASVFAMDMLLLKFIQGLPIVGIFGGAANPVYYQKVLRYVQLKYRKRYLLKLLDTGTEEAQHPAAFDIGVQQN